MTGKGFRLISMLLAVILAVMTLPLYAFAAESTAFSDADVRENSEEENSNSVTVSPKGEVYEDTSLRENHVKHIHLADGSYLAVAYASPVHYLDDEGNWQEIDSRLSAVGEEFTTTDSRIKFAKKITGNGTLFTLHEGNSKITFSLVGAVKGTKGTVVTETPSEEESDPINRLTDLSRLSSTLRYEEILEHVDIEYVTGAGAVKENIIVKERTGNYSYAFQMKLNNLSPEMNEDGSVSIRNSDRKTVYYIPSPVVYDSLGISAEGASYTLTGSGNRWTLTVSVPEDWMNAPDRAYPVTVDPAICKNDDNTVSTVSIHSVSTGTSYTGSEMYVSNRYTSYWKTTTLPFLPDSAYITDATFYAYCVSNNVSESAPIGLYQVLTDWDTSLTYQKYTSNQEGKLDLDPTDYCMTGPSGQYYQWNVTDIVKQWYDGSTDLYSFALSQIDNLTVNGTVTFASHKATETKNRPSISISYRKISGVTDYWSYSKQAVGNAGTGYVNRMTGGLTFVIPTLSTAESLFGYTLSLIYDSEFANKPYISSYADIPYWSGYFGYGFRLNANESVITKTCRDRTGTYRTQYIWRDGNGTEHAFVPAFADDGSVDSYCDEDGLGLVLKTSDSNGSCEIQSADGTTRSFTHYSANFSLYGACLTKITDANGNQLYINCAEGGIVTSISVKPVNCSIVTYLTLEYQSNGRLSSIKDSVTGESYTFTYSGNYLTGVTYSHTINGSVSTFTTQYQYDSGGHLLKATDGLTQLQMQYGWSSGKVTTVTEYASGSATAGQKIGFTYQDHYSEERSSGKDDVYNTSDDILTCYSFDNYGRCVSSYSTDLRKKNIYGATTGDYTDASDNIKKQNKLETVVTSGLNAVNMITNGGFEHSTISPWGYTSSNVSISEDNPYSGKSSAKFTISNTEVIISQKLYLRAGTYTLSMMAVIPNEDVTVSFEILPINNSLAIGSAQNGMVPRTNSGYSEYTKGSFTFTLAENGLVEIPIHVSTTSTTTRTVYLDDVMLERGTGGTPLNMVDCGGFTATTCYINGTPIKSVDQYWEYSDVDYCIPIKETTSLDDDYMSMMGLPNQSCNVKQEILKDSLLHNEMLYVSGFGRANALMTGSKFVDGQWKSDAATFQIRVRVNYNLADGTSEEENYVLEFPRVTDQWVYVSGALTLPPDSVITDIEVFCEYDYQYGEADFDNIYVSLAGYEDTSGFVRYGYNEDGLLSVVHTASLTTTYTYEDNSSDVKCVKTYRGSSWNPGSGTDYFSTKTDYTYDTHHQLTGESTYYGTNTTNPQHSATYTYNDGGLLTQSTVTADSKKSVTIYTYDTVSGSRTFGALKTETNLSEGTTTQYFYDSNSGQLTAVVNPDSTATVYTYDPFGRLTGVQSAIYTGTVSTTDLAEVGYTYQNGRLSAITTGSTVYSFSYDPFGNSTGISAGDHTLAEYTYNPNNGKPASMTYGNGTVVTYSYDELDRLSGICYTSGDGTVTQSAAYTYDNRGNLLEYKDILNGKTYRYQYSGSNRLTAYYEVNTATNVIGYHMLYWYDSNSRVHQINYDVPYTLSDGTKSSAYLSYEFSYNDAPETISSLSVYGTGFNSYYYLGFTYDSRSRLTQKVYDYRMGSSPESILKLTTSYTYQTNGNYMSDRLSSVKNQIGSTSTTWRYEYDSMGRITKVTNSGGYVLNRYHYDDLGQLVREDSREKGYTYYYTYDDAGNLLYKEAFALTIDEGSSLSGKTPVYTNVYQYGDDSWGDLLTSYKGHTITYDAIGNPLSYYGRTAYTFTWKNGRQLATASTGSYTLSFEYNDEGIRTSKTVNGVKHSYTLDGSRIVSEAWGNNLLVYIYDEAGAPIGMLYRKTSYADGVFDRYLFERDVFGNIISVYNIDTGAKVGSYCYDAWGNCTVLTNTNGIGAMNPFRYRGYYLDVETNLYYLQTRYYDSYVGRFINADGYVSTGKSLIGNNMFAYCDNNPIMNIDPTGKVAGILVMGGILSSLLKVAVFIGLVVITTAAVIGVATEIYNAIDSSQATTKEEEKEASLDTTVDNQQIYIYRYGGSNPGNLTPKEKDLLDGRGLSFSTVPRPNCAVTTIDAINATGVLYAVQDNAYHVSVYPIGGTMEDWVNAGSESVWTKTLKSIVVKWDGGN